LRRSAKRVKRRERPRAPESRLTLAERVDTLPRPPEEPPLRIALVVERFAPGTGGVENVAWQVAHELVRQGEDVRVVARECDPTTGIPVVRVASAGRRHPLRALAFSRAAARAVRDGGEGDGGFDVVHSFTRTRHQDLFRAGGGSHDDYLRRTASPAGAWLRRALPRHRSLLALERRVFADPRQRIQCASRLVADRLVAVHGVARERILLLPNAVDAARFDARRHRDAARRLRASLEGGDAGGRGAADGDGVGSGPIWLFPGSGWRRKGLDRCLSALARVADPGLRLWVAGRDDPGPWRRRAERLGLAGRVTFLGPRNDLEVVYAAVDGVILPTRYDAFANVTFEAAAAGLPILTTRANGAAEWLSAEACRVVDAPGGVLDGGRDAATTDAPERTPDEEACVAGLAAALRECADADVRRRLGDAARREVAAFDWPGHVRALRAEYARIAEARSLRRAVAARVDALIGAGLETLPVLQDNRRRTLFRAPLCAGPEDAPSTSPVPEPAPGPPIAADPTELVLKRHRLASGRHPLRERLKRLAGRSPARREERAQVALRAAGVTVPRVFRRVALANGDELVASEHVAGEPLTAAYARSAPPDRARLVAALADTIARLHASGHVHGDLHLGNLLWSAPSEAVVLLDLQRARRARGAQGRLRDLASLELSLLRADWPASARADLRCRLGVGSDPAFDTALRRFAVDHLRGRARRQLRSPRALEPLRMGSLRGFGERGVFAPDDLAARIAALARDATSAERRPRRDGRAFVAEIEVAGRRLVVKWTGAASLAHRLAAAFRGSPAARAFWKGRRESLLWARGARPLAYLEARRLGLPGESWLVLERVGDVDLDALRPSTPAAARALAEALGAWLADGHALGLGHADLKGSNLRVGFDAGAARFWLVDLEDLSGPSVAGETDEARLLALAQLNASLADEAFDLAAREAALARYLERLPFADPALDRARATREIARRSLARLHRWRGEGCGAIGAIGAESTDAAVAAADAQPTVTVSQRK